MIYIHLEKLSHGSHSSCAMLISLGNLQWIAMAHVGMGKKRLVVGLKVYSLKFEYPGWNWWLIRGLNQTCHKKIRNSSMRLSGNWQAKTSSLAKTTGTSLLVALHQLPRLNVRSTPLVLNPHAMHLVKMWRNNPVGDFSMWTWVRTIAFGILRIMGTS